MESSNTSFKQLNWLKNGREHDFKNIESLGFIGSGEIRDTEDAVTAKEDKPRESEECD